MDETMDDVIMDKIIAMDKRKEFMDIDKRKEIMDKKHEETFRLLKKWELDAVQADTIELDSYIPHSHIIGSPLLVLKSLSLVSYGNPYPCHPYPHGPHDLYLHGHVLMIDDLHNKFYIFRQQRHTPKKVHTCSVELPGHRYVYKTPLLEQCDFQTPRCFPKSFTLHILLFGFFTGGPVHHATLVDACLTTSLNSPAQLPRGKDYFHHTLWGKSNGIDQRGHQTSLCAVDYEIFRHALVSLLSISLVTDDDDDATPCSDAVAVNGSITAKDQAGHIPLPLLDAKLKSPQLDPEFRRPLHLDLLEELRKLELGVMTKVSNLAIPASSLVSIQVDLEVLNDYGEVEDKICGSFLYEPSEHHWVLPQATLISGRRFKVIVFVKCQHAMTCLREYDVREWCFSKSPSIAKCEMQKWLDLHIESLGECIKSDAHDASESPGECVRKKESYDSVVEYILGIEAPDTSSRKTVREEKFMLGIEASAKRPRINMEEPIYINPELRCLRPQDWYVDGVPDAMVELFCISVHWNSDEPVSRICGDIKCYNPLVEKSFTMFNEQAYVFPGELIQLDHPQKCISCSRFCVDVTLEDNEGSRISNGRVFFNHTAEGWFNRRLCSIIKGKHGYAAVHYTVYSNAIQARLNLTIVSKFHVGDDFKVYGTIAARYDKFMYGTVYDNYYQSVLFQKKFDNAVSLLDDGRIPLSKCVVAVPLTASLLVQACIFVKIEGADVKKLKIMAHFNPQKPNEKQLIETRHGSNYCSSVSVEWSR